MALCNPEEVETISGHFESKFSPKMASDKAIDARNAEFLNNSVRWSMITLDGSSGDRNMCWVGGYVYTEKPWDASWEDHEDLNGPTRNGAAISISSTTTKLTGFHFFNVHDGVRTSEAFDWIVERSWGEYVRDDCIENDHLHSGRISDSLFDGCYAGISTKPSAEDTESDGRGEVVEVDSVLLRMEAMPYPFKVETKEGIIDVDGNPYSGSGIPFGYGSLFKLTELGRNPHFAIENSTFLAEHLTAAFKLNFPQASLVDRCENNTIIWLGPGEYPGALPDQKFPGCFNIVTGQAGRDLWRQKVTDWHKRHPDVGAQRKPGSPGDLTFPRVF